VNYYLAILFVSILIEISLKMTLLYKNNMSNLERLQEVERKKNIYKIALQTYFFCYTAFVIYFQFFL
jgi:hypothetical protein